MTYFGEQIIPWEACAQKSNELLNLGGELLVSLSINNVCEEDTKWQIIEGMKKHELHQILEKSWKSYCHRDSTNYFFVFKK